MRWLWFARLAWVALPVASGSAYADALDGRSTAVATTAAALAYVGWGVGLVSLFAPRPWGLTILRIVAPTAVAVGVTLAVTQGAAGIFAAATTLVAAALVLGPDYAQAAGNALAYGDESRFPLRIPPPLLAIAVPIAVALIATAGAAPPLLVAAGEPIWGAITAAIGIPLAVFLARALHQLSCRWLVLVPAGVTLVDPLMLFEPVLIRRARVQLMAPAPRDLPRDAEDLRLGGRGGVLLATHEPVELGRRRGRSGAAVVRTSTLILAPVRTPALLEAVATRRVPTGQAAGSAIPPPSTTSPS